MANYRWSQVPRLIFSKDGRRRIWNSILYRLKFIIIPVADIYRRTVIRRVKIIAVVGSFGKTTTTRAIATALGLNPDIHQGQNNGVFLAALLLSILPWARFQVIEVGIHKKGLMTNYAALIRPDIVAVTCIGSEHNSSLGDLIQTREEKAQMVRALPKNSLAVLNGDDPNVKIMSSYTEARTITHGYEDDNEFQARFISTDLADGTHFSIKAGNKNHELSVKLFGRAMIRSIMAALIIARELGVDESDAIRRLTNLSPVSERLMVMQTPSGASIVVDSLKSAFETIELALETLGELSANRKIVIIGEVEEPNRSLGDIYRDFGNRIAKVADQLIFIGSTRTKRPLFNGARIAGMPDGSLHYFKNSVWQAQEAAMQLVQPGDLVLIKGRSSQKLIRIALALKGEKVLCKREFCRQKAGCLKCDFLKRNSNDLYR